MSFESAAVAADALAALADVGVEATYGSVTTSPYDPATGSATTTTLGYPTTAVLFPTKTQWANGTLIEGTGQTAYLPALPVMAKPGDTLTIGDVVWKVTKSAPLMPTGVVVLNVLSVEN